MAYRASSCTCPRLRDSLEQERRDISQLENLESIEGEHIFGRGLFESLRTAENAEVDLEHATESWLCGTPGYPEGIGLTRRVDDGAPSVHRYVVSPSASLALQHDAVRKYLGPITGGARRYTFRRETARLHDDVALVRPGETLLDVLERFDPRRRPWPDVRLLEALSERKHTPAGCSFYTAGGSRCGPRSANGSRR